MVVNFKFFERYFLIVFKIFYALYNRKRHPQSINCLLNQQLMNQLFDQSIVQPNHQSINQS